MAPDNMLPLRKSASQAARKLGRDKLYVPVVDALESRILSGELPIGERLPAEADIASDFNVSSRSVREAIQILETKGLVRRKHGERAMVVRDDVGEFLGSLSITVRQLFSQKSNYFVQLMDVRRIIETEAVGCLAAVEGGGANQEVEDAIIKMRQAADAGDFSGFTDGDAAFHLGLVHSINNEILNVFYNNLFALIIEVIQVSSRVPKKSLDVAYAEHEKIYRLIKASDTDGAKAAIRRHIERSESYVRVALDEKLQSI
jgi:DNA-binding FadR family transcriptional regulator